MSETITNIMKHLDENRAILRAAVDRVPAQDRERRPAADRWSVAEVIEHLSIIETRVTALVGNALAGLSANGATGAAETTHSINQEHHAIVVNRAQRVKARETTEPTGSLDAVAAWSALEQSRAGLLTLLQKAATVDLSGFTHPHPIAGPINGYEWIAFVGGHEARHADQIDEIATQLISASA